MKRNFLKQNVFLYKQQYAVNDLKNKKIYIYMKMYIRVINQNSK